jgi:excinuclease ABC subunit A
MIFLHGGKEKFAVASKTLGITKEYKIEFEGISHFIKNQHDESGSSSIKRWAKEFMDEVIVQFVKDHDSKKKRCISNQREKHQRFISDGYFRFDRLV